MYYLRMILFVVISTGLFSCATDKNAWKEDRVREMEAARIQRQAEVAQYGLAYANAKNPFYKARLRKLHELKDNPKALKEYKDQTRPTKKVLIITEDKKTIKGEVITVYDDE